jgi:serine/threonine protein kinase/tetratricopeptide (TPR) repeat protein
MTDLQQIGKYKILGKIGQGAMGEVFKAHDPILNRYVAIKTMSAAIGSDDELRKRFLREAQSAARLNHTNIITLYDFGEDQGKIYMAMELLQGADLKDLLGSNSLNSIEDKVGLMEQTCDGLAFAHANQVVHRDLKPANIHIQPNGQVKIMDFGLARLGASEMTRTGMVMGTPNYMSPEQVRGQRADSRSDIFALGAVFYELLTNHKAFDAESLHAVLFQVLEHEPESVRHWAPEVPEVLVHLVERALRKNPAERFQNAGELREALRMVREVFEGTLDEESAIQAVLAPSAEASDATILGESSTRDAEATRIEPSPPGPGSGADVKRSGIGKRPGSGSRPPAIVSGGGTRVNPGSGATVVPPRSGVRGPGSGAGRSVQRSGASVSRSGSAARMAPPQAASSKLPLILGGGAALVIAAGIGIFFALRGPSKAEIGDDPVRNALVTSSLQSARQSLEYKNFSAAIDNAQKALKLDEGNAEAKQILDKAQSTLKQLDAAAEEAKQAVQAGQYEKASAALQRAMEINPTHPVVAELSRQLDSTFKSKADEARQSMHLAKAGADRARAGSLQSYSEAAQAAGEAEGLFKAAQFIPATQKFLEAQNQYDRARRAAEERVAPPPPVTTARFPPPTQPPMTQPPMTQPPATQPPVTAPPVTAPPHTTPPVTAPPPPVNDEPAVRRVITEYKRALEGRDLGLFKAVKPNTSADDEKKLRDSFNNIRSWEVAIDIDSVRIEGDRAVVKVSRRDTVNGQRTQPQSQTFTLVKGGGGWTIRDIGRN